MMNIKCMAKIVSTMILSLCFIATPAQSELMSIVFDGYPNDCKGYFNNWEGNTDNGFSGCQIFLVEDEIQYLLSPVIYKRDYEEGSESGSDKNSAAIADTIDGSEFDVFSGESDLNTGTFTYTSGEDDPGIRYWTAKAGTAFILFFDGDATLCGADLYSLACWDSAAVIESGEEYSYWTPDGKGLSHLVWYDSDPVQECPPDPEVGTPCYCAINPDDCDFGGTGLPEPQTLLILGSGLIGLFISRRRKMK